MKIYKVYYLGFYQGDIKGLSERNALDNWLKSKRLCESDKEFFIKCYHNLKLVFKLS